MNFYEELFWEEYSWRPKLDRMVFKSIDQFRAECMEKFLKKDEVLGMVRGRARDKALGLDGFPWHFSKFVGIL